VNGNRAIIEGDTHTQPVAGVAPNITLMAGLNFGFLDLRPVTVFGNWFSRQGQYREFDADLKNWGAHLQVKLFQPHKEYLWNPFLQWGGIAITSGFDEAHLRLTLSRAFSRRIPLVQGGRTVANVDVTNSQGTLVLDMHSYSVPLEVTTNFRFLYVLGVYGGAGFDWQFGGGSEMNIDLSGTLNGSVPSQSGPPVNIGSARVTATESASPSKGKVRGIVGVQANLWFVKLFTQLNLVPDPFIASVALGLRLVW
jgi:hypothetical protein